MTDNSYSPSNIELPKTESSDTQNAVLQVAESVKEKRFRLFIKILSWIFLVYGAIQLVNAITIVYQNSKESGVEIVRSYSTFLIPILTIQSGLLLRDRSKWSIVTCLSIVALIVFAIVSLYRPSKLDHRSIFSAIFEAAPAMLFIMLIEYLILACILGFLWKAKQLR